MDEWRSDPTWRHEERLFTDGEPTYVVRDEGNVSMDPDGLAMISGGALATPRASAAPAPGRDHVPPAPVTAAVADDPGIRRDGDRGRETGGGFDDDAWTSMGAESTYDLHEAYSPPTAATAGAEPSPSSFAPASFGARDAPTGGYIPGGHPDAYAAPARRAEVDPDLAGAVFPGATWAMPSPASAGPGPGFASLGPLPDPSVAVSDPALTSRPPAEVVFFDPDVRAARAGWSAAPAPTKRRSVLRQAISLLIVAGVAAWRVGGLDRFIHQPAAARPTVPWATAWDPQFADLVQFVQTERGLTFKNPVAVDLTPVDEFDAEVKRANLSASATTAEDEDPYQVMLEALGLAHRPVSVTAAATTTVPEPASSPGASDGEAQGAPGASMVIGRYEPWTHMIKVRGTELTDEVKATLVHELTHALQDQHFDLQGTVSSATTNGAASALRAAAEGDAMLVEEAYRRAHGLLPAGDEAGAAAAEQPLGSEDVPSVDRPEDNLDVAWEFLDYELSIPYVRLLAGRGGRAERDALFADPSSSEASVLFPERRLNHVPLAEIDVPALDPGDKRVKTKGAPTDVGPYVLGLALTRAEQPVYPIYQMTKAWNGDAFVAFHRGNSSCARIAIASIDVAGTTTTSGAFTAWAAAPPAGAARTVTTDFVEGNVVVTACTDQSGSTGTTATTVAPPADGSTVPPADPLVSFLTIELVRSVVLATPIDGAVTTHTMTERRCIADLVAEDIGKSNEVTASRLSGELANMVQGAAIRCHVIDPPMVVLPAPGG